MIDITQNLKDRGFNEGTMIGARAYEEGFSASDGVTLVRGRVAYVLGNDGHVRRFVAGEQVPYSAKGVPMPNGETKEIGGSYKAEPYLFDWHYPVEYFA